MYCAENDKSVLQFDHKDPREKKLHRLEIQRMGFTARVSFYRNEARKGKLHVACFTCNRMKWSMDHDQFAAYIKEQQALRADTLDDANEDYDPGESPF